MNDLLIDIRSQLSKSANSERATFSKNYMKSSYSFYGLTVPFLRQIAKQYKNLDIKETFSLFDKLWNSNNHEEMSLSIFLIQNLKKHDLELWQFVMQRINKAKSWDHIDYLSTDILSKIFLEHPELMSEIKSLSTSKNPWLRRTSINATYQLIKKNKIDLTFRLAETLCYDEDIFVQKGTGWMLREAGKRNRLALRDFLMLHLDMKSNAFSYATEKMPELRKIRKEKLKEIKN